MQITGLDLSLTATGIARLAIADEEHHRDDWILEAVTVTSTGHRSDTYAQRAERLEQLKATIVREATDTDLVVIEGPSYGSAGSGTWDRAGLWWLVVGWLTGTVPVAIVPPTTLKTFAAGKGTASKEAMAVALYKRTLEECGNDNEVDAAWLAFAGAQWAGRGVVDLPEAQGKALEKAQWPDTAERSPEASRACDLLAGAGGGGTA